MRSDLTLYLVTGIFLILLVVLTHWCWSRSKMALTTPKPTRRKREPKPFAGYTRKPECELCAHGMDSYPQAPGAPPPRMIFTRGRRRQVETTGHFCPHPDCSYPGWVDWGNVRANGHPNGRRWRQLVCLGCHGSFLETVGTPFHGKQVDPDKRSCRGDVRVKKRVSSESVCKPEDVSKVLICYPLWVRVHQSHPTWSRT